MASHTILVLRCDRVGCGREERLDDPNRRYDWGKMGYVQFNGPKRNVADNKTTVSEAKDVCPDCMKQLNSWWRDST